MNTSAYIVMKKTDAYNCPHGLTVGRHNHFINHHPFMPMAGLPMAYTGTYTTFVFNQGTAEYDEIESLIQNRADRVTALTLDQAMEVACRMSQELQELMDEAKAAGSDLSGVQALINDFDQLHKLWVSG